MTGGERKSNMLESTYCFWRVCRDHDVAHLSPGTSLCQVGADVRTGLCCLLSYGSDADSQQSATVQAAHAWGEMAVSFCAAQPHIRRVRRGETLLAPSTGHASIVICLCVAFAAL